MTIDASTPHAIDSRHGYAMLLMMAGSIVISFGGLVQRNIEFADAWQINVYRSIGMLIASLLILFFSYRGRLQKTLTGIGPLGILGALLLSSAGVCFVQALTNTTVANALFILGSIPFFAAIFARIFFPTQLWLV